MTMIERVVSEILGEIVGFSGHITDDLGHAEVPGWDSVAHISIVEEMEKRFAVRFTADELTEMTDVGRIKSILARHGVSDVGW